MPCEVLFTWELGGGLGHIARLRPLAEAMQELGRSVAFAVRDVRFCSVVFSPNGEQAGRRAGGQAGEDETLLEPRGPHPRPPPPGGGGVGGGI
jgi:hypothetical protein